METPNESAKPASGGMGVLVADDQLEMRNLLKTILRTMRITEIDGVSDGLAAIECYGRLRHELVFLDIEMPAMDGFNTLSKIIEINPDAFVVMVSGHSSVDNVKKSLELGAKGFVGKPYTSSKIAEMLKKFRTATR